MDIVGEYVVETYIPKRKSYSQFITFSVVI